MKRFAKIVLFSTAMLSMVLFSCQKFDEYPVEPHITYQKFTLLIDSVYNPVNDTTVLISNRGILSFTFTDGDGDLGLMDWDTLPPFDKESPYYFNIIVKYFEKRNGVFEQVTRINPDGTVDTVNFNGRLPYLTPNGVHKAIKGTIEDTLLINNPVSTFDTIKFKFYIYDRALHKSNEEETPEIIILK